MEESQSGCIIKVYIRMIKQTVECLPRMNPANTKNVKFRSQRVKKIRTEATKNSKRLDKSILDKNKRRYKTVEYKCDDNVLIRISCGGKKSTPKGKFVVGGKVLKKANTLTTTRSQFFSLVKLMPLNCGSQPKI